MAFRNLVSTVKFGDGPVAADLIEAASCISFCSFFVSATDGIVAVHMNKKELSQSYHHFFDFMWSSKSQNKYGHTTIVYYCFVARLFCHVVSSWDFESGSQFVWHWLISRLVFTSSRLKSEIHLV